MAKTKEKQGLDTHFPAPTATATESKKAAGESISCPRFPKG